MTHYLMLIEKNGVCVCFASYGEMKRDPRYLKKFLRVI